MEEKKLDNNIPLVSVVITTYKRHDYLQRAISSVLNQTYTNLEVIVVDDNDEDSDYSKQVKELIKQICVTDNRIKYVPMGKNSGACKARNKGIEISRGEYVNFLDDDDEFKPEKIELQVKKYLDLKDEHITIGCFAEIKNENGKIIQYDRNRVNGDVFFENLCTSICQTSLPLFRKDLLIQSGGFEEIPSSQEHLMMARLFDICPYYDYVDKELVTIYHHSGERISNGEKKVQGAIELVERFKRFYYKISDEQIREVTFATVENVVNAFLLKNDRKSAWNYYKKNSNCFNVDRKIKTIIKIICGGRGMKCIFVVRTMIRR